MKVLSRLLLLSAVAVTFGVISASDAVAQIPEASPLSVTERLDVGGTVLEPGNYLIRVLPLFTNRNMLQVTNEDRSTVYATVLSIPHSIGEGNEQLNTEYVFFPATNGAPRALRTWFAPNSTSGGGHDIVYPERRAMELAATVNEPVVAYKDDTKVEELKTTKLEVVTHEKVIIAYVEPTPPPKPVAVAQVRELPKTASSLPLFASIGVLLLCAAVGIRALRSV